MANNSGEQAAAAAGDRAAQPSLTADRERREIKGGIPYTTSPGVFKKALELIIPAERPDKFGANYMETILKLSGGSARSVPPLLKKMQFIGADGAPTLLYSKFKTDGGRSQAAYEGIKHAFSELFRRNEYIHKADEGGVKDTIVEITGLKRSDPIVRLMYQTFDALRGFIHGDVSSVSEQSDANSPTIDHNISPGASSRLSGGTAIMSLTAQIDIVQDTGQAGALTLTEDDAVQAAAFIIRKWERDGHWSAVPEAREILALYRRLNLAAQ